MGEVEAEEGVAEGKVAVFAPVPVPLRARGLAQVLQGRKGHHVQPPGLQFQKHGRGIGDDPVDGLVEIGAALEIGIGRPQREHGPGLPLQEAEGPGAYRLARRRGIHEVLPFQNVLGQDSPHPRHERARKGLFVPHFKGEAPGFTERLNGQKIPGVGRGGLRVDHGLVGKFHVVRRERYAVLPADVVAQDEAQEPSSVQHLIGFGRPRDNLQVLVVFEWCDIEEVHDLLRGRVGGQVGNEVGRLPDGTHEDASAVDGFLRRGRGRPRIRGKKAQQRAKRRPKCQEVLFHTYSLFIIKIFPKIVITYLCTLENKRHLAYKDNIRLIAYT